MAARKKAKTKRVAKAARSSFRKAPAKQPATKKKKPAAKKQRAVRAVRADKSSRHMFMQPGQSRVLGEISIPSGKLAIFDIGLFGYLPREALEPAIVTCEVPRDRVLPVLGARVGKGRFADCWDHVAVSLGSGEIAHSKKLGEAGVDFARLVCMDHAALDAWQHEDSLDGKADVVFWGRDEAVLARVLNAKRVEDGFGWVDLSVEEAEKKADLIAHKKAENKWLLASDLRPHSHHYYALAAARKSPERAGMLDVAGTRMMLLFTSWGDGVFPIYLDLDADDRPVQIRIQLATAESNAAMASVNP
jgi:hypothetical protein